ncbi:McrC family protein [Herbaspirillum sp. SJZ107]|uniref:McrC family protein n=1 Tax=Herbaspirillum sp. SJZ107 TaxID=2572881 RepID=UPI001153FBB0|nr:McrC family protein [Herbaspirillum sp. SJZ107]TQK03469.1 5-methylcytosine-specific restriction enzyme subunit McrC [Herbaspirillum sp. SJZ107]
MTKSRISLREHGRLHVGAFDPSKPSVTCEQAALLTGLRARHGFDVFRWTNQHTIAAQQYVGTVQVGQVTVEVLPKIETDTGSPDETTIRRNLIAMLMTARGVQVSEGDIARVAVQRHGILEILIRLFCDRLFAQVHRGLVHRYEPRDEQLAVLRGRLDLSGHLRLNAANPERLYCRFDEFQADNDLNRVLKAALALLFRVANDLDNQRRLAELLLAFDGISDVPAASLPWHRIGFDRLSERYRPAFRLAELFLKSKAPDVTAGAQHGVSLFFDMNSLFEEYIGRVATRVFQPVGIEVKLQGPQRFIATDESNGTRAFAMRPDVVGMRDGRAAWIVDTKWKQLSPDEVRDGAGQSDIYQMYAYASSYGCPDVVLLYPHHSGLGTQRGARASYQFQTAIRMPDGLANGRLRIATIDLGRLDSIPIQLQALFAEQPAYTAGT